MHECPHYELRQTVGSLDGEGDITVCIGPQEGFEGQHRCQVGTERFGFGFRRRFVTDGRLRSHGLFRDHHIDIHSRGRFGHHHRGIHHLHHAAFTHAVSDDHGPIFIANEHRTVIEARPGDCDRTAIGAEGPPDVTPDGIHRLVVDHGDTLDSGLRVQFDGTFRAGVHRIREAGEFQRNLLPGNVIVKPLAVQLAVFDPEEGERQVLRPVGLALEPDLLQRTRRSGLSVDMNLAGSQAEGVSGRVATPEFRNRPQITGGTAETGRNAVTLNLLQEPRHGGLQCIILGCHDQVILCNLCVIFFLIMARSLTFSFQTEDGALLIAQIGFQEFTGWDGARKNLPPRLTVAGFEVPRNRMRGGCAVRSRYCEPNFQLFAVQDSIVLRCPTVTRVERFYTEPQVAVVGAAFGPGFTLGRSCLNLQVIPGERVAQHDAEPALIVTDFFAALTVGAPANQGA